MVLKVRARGSRDPVGRYQGTPSGRNRSLECVICRPILGRDFPRISQPVNVIHVTASPLLIHCPEDWEGLLFLGWLVGLRAGLWESGWSRLLL